ncbi:MAG: hypothetical protein RL223_4113 [Pseudomonadota bacterium]|jgi:putative transposase
MARLPRLVLHGLPHLVSLHGHSGRVIAPDEIDRQALLTALREAVRLHGVAVHAWTLADDHLHLLVTPATDDALGRAMQDFGRRYVAGYNRRHGSSGSLWAGRFRAAVLQPGAWSWQALLFIDGHAGRRGGPVLPAADEPPRSSAHHHLGWLRDPLLSPVPGYWALGNTPFEREAAYRACLLEGQGAARLQSLTRAARHGWACGEDDWVQALAARAGDRPLAPRPRGRPVKVRPDTA